MKLSGIDIRLAKVDGDILEIAESYSDNFVKDPNSPYVGYTAAENRRSGSYGVSIYSYNNPTPDENTFIMVAGPKLRVSRKIMKKFLKKTGIDSHPAPEHVYGIIAIHIQEKLSELPPFSSRLKG